MALKPGRNAHFCILFCNDARKTLAGTKKKQSTISQNIGRRQQKEAKSQHLLRTLDPHRLKIFAFFFGVPANVL